MSNQSVAKCRLCRREGEKLFLKGARCSTQKCALIKRNFPPGMHGLVRGGGSEFGIQLRAKQKAKRIYGLRERQFYNYYREAARKGGVTGDNLLILLESRLDNIVYRAGLAESRQTARQLVGHGHFLVNGKRVNIPSFQVKVNDLVSLRPRSQKSNYFKQILPFLKKHKTPVYLKVDPQKMEVKMTTLINRDNLPEVGIDAQAIIEYYSK